MLCGSSRVCGDVVVCHVTIVDDPDLLQCLTVMIMGTQYGHAEHYDPTEEI